MAVLEAHPPPRAAPPSEQARREWRPPAMAVFAILLPVTSRPRHGADYATAGAGVDAVLGRLDAVAAAVARCGPAHPATVTVGVDKADTALTREVVAAPFARLHLPVRVVVFPPALCGRLCAMWNALAAAATAAKPPDGGVYAAGPPPTHLLLLGDDVTVTAPATAWGTALVADYDALVAAGAPAATGVVAAVDATFPGFPTFPVVHASHLAAFRGRLLPAEWEGATQGGDPYLFELHARVGAAAFSARLTLVNAIGGNADAPAAPPPRYGRVAPPRGAVAAALERDEATLRAYLTARDGVPPAPSPRLDVVIPCWRCDVAAVRRIVGLPLPPRAAATLFIVIVDAPHHPAAAAVAALEADCWARDRRRVRVRLNDRNRGVSYTRNRGLREASAPYVLFLDDDVVPSEGLLFAYAAAMAASEATAATPLPPPLPLRQELPARRGGADGPDGGRRRTVDGGPPEPAAPETLGPPPRLRRHAYAGVVAFPPATTAFHAGLVISQLLYFFGAPADSPIVPWGVTANLLLPVGALGDDPFDEAAPPGGGGEDILACVRLRAAAAAAAAAAATGPDDGPAAAHAWPLRSVPDAVVVHPWWEGGRPCYAHFGRWSAGDGRLVDLLPAHTFGCAANGVELAAAAAVAAVAAAPRVGVAAAAAAAAAAVAAVAAVDVALTGASAATAKVWWRRRRKEISPRRLVWRGAPTPTAPSRLHTLATPPHPSLPVTSAASDGGGPRTPPPQRQPRQPRWRRQWRPHLRRVQRGELGAPAPQCPTSTPPPPHPPQPPRNVPPTCRHPLPLWGRPHRRARLCGCRRRRGGVRTGATAVAAVAAAEAGSAPARPPLRPPRPAAPSAECRPRPPPPLAASARCPPLSLPPVPPRRPPIWPPPPPPANPAAAAVRRSHRRRRRRRSR